MENDTPPLPKEPKKLDIADLYVGFEDKLNWTANPQELEDFIKISGDSNPLHTDDKYAKKCGFSSRVVHGLFICTKLSGFLGMMLPGYRCLLLSQSLDFPNPIYLNEKISISGKVANIQKELSVVELRISAKKRNIVAMRGRVTCKLLY